MYWILETVINLHKFLLLNHKYYSKESVVRLLLEKAGDVNATGRYYGSALQATSYWGHKSTSFYYKIKTKNIDQAYWYFTKLAIVARGLSIDEFKRVFTECLPPFLQGSMFERKTALDEFEGAYNRLEDQLLSRFKVYTGAWLETQGVRSIVECTWRIG